MNRLVITMRLSNLQYSTNVSVQSAGVVNHAKVSNFMDWHQVETVPTSVDTFQLFYNVLINKGGYVFGTILSCFLTFSYKVHSNLVAMR